MFRDVQELENKLAEPSAELLSDLAAVDGDIMLLGVGGKMGPSMARLAVNAIKQAGLKKRVIGVARFSSEGLRNELEKSGVETIAADILNDNELQALPDVKNIIFMAGYKFGTTGNEHLTWAMNAYLPGRVADKFKNSRIVVFSTGNVYPLTPLTLGGATEQCSPAGNGEYGQSCLGRERVFEHFSHKYQIPMFIYRLNYAIDLRYGILQEVAKAVKEGKPIDITIGHANVIWQGDANEIALRALNNCSCPPKFMNVTGPETMSLRWAAGRFGEIFGVDPNLVGEEATTVLLSNSAIAMQTFGYPKVTLNEMIDWVGHWVLHDREDWKKETHYQEREGKY